MNERFLKAIIFTAGAACLYTFIAMRVPSMFNAALQEKIIPGYWENTKYGELYYFGMVRNFREYDLPPCDVKYRFTDRMPDVKNADILIFGDSFFDFSRMTTFPERLGDTLGMGTFYERMDRPLRYLANHNYENSSEKILLYESAERYIPTRFTTPHMEGPDIDPRSDFRKWLSETRMTIFQPNSAVLYNTFLKRNYLTTDLFSLSATMKFDVLGYITDLTPKYYLGGEVPWLFYSDQLNDEPSSFYYHHTDKEIDTYCDNIVDLSEKLYKDFRLRMVFMAIPSKYTIYHGLINNDPYNDFLPRLYAGLEERGIPVIKVYQDFMDADQVLYYGTDTHWRESGLNIALDKTVHMLDSLNQTN